MLLNCAESEKSVSCRYMYSYVTISLGLIRHFFFSLYKPGFPQIESHLIYKDVGKMQLFGMYGFRALLHCLFLAEVTSHKSGFNHIAMTCLVKYACLRTRKGQSKFAFSLLFLDAKTIWHHLNVVNLISSQSNLSLIVQQSMKKTEHFDVSL